MGISTRSNLFYGFPITIKEDELFWNKIGWKNDILDIEIIGNDYWEEEDGPRNYLSYKHHSFQTEYGVPIEINNLDKPILETINKAKQLCKNAGIEWKESKWYLAGYYG